MQSLISDSKEKIQSLLPNKSETQSKPDMAAPSQESSGASNEPASEPSKNTRSEDSKITGSEVPETSDPTSKEEGQYDPSKQTDSKKSEPESGVQSGEKTEQTDVDSAPATQQPTKAGQTTEKAEQASKSSHEDVKAFLAENTAIKFIRLEWVDYTATVRCRIITPRQTLRLASQSKTVSTANPLTSAFLIEGSFHEVNVGVKDQLVPDWSTLRTLHYEPTHASVLCFIEDGKHGLSTDPRHLLKQTVADIEQKHGMTFLIGLEAEFYLMASPTATEPVQDDVRQYCSTASLRTPYQDILTSITQALEDADIPVWASHTESALGQFEVATDPLSPAKAADSVIYIHEAIKTIAWKHGYHATMHPKPFDRLHGIGLHMHLSLQKQTDKDDSFLQGVLSSIPAISAISMPNYDSWDRRLFAGGDYIGWDVENRMSSIRKIERAYWEMRFIDCMSNPHLTLALILGTGIKAWEEATPLTVKATSDGGDQQSEKVRAPRDLKDAIEALKKDEAVKRVLGEALWDRYVRYKEHEEQVLGEMTLQERREMAIKLF